MVYVVPPIVHHSRYALVFEHPVETACAFEQFVLPTSLTYADIDVALGVETHPRVILGHLAQEINGRVHKRQIITIEWEAISSIIQTAEGYDRIEDVGAAEEEVAGMERSHRAARDDESLVGSLAYLGDKLLADIVEPSLMLLYAPAVVLPLTAPRLRVDTIAGDHPYFAPFYPG